MTLGTRDRMERLLLSSLLVSNQVGQHLLLLEPLPPRFFRHVLEDALAELAGIGREIESLGLAPQLDAFDYARHAVSMRARSGLFKPFAV